MNANGAAKIVGPVIVVFSRDYVFGRDGNPTREQYERALRSSLGEFAEPDTRIV